MSDSLQITVLIITNVGSNITEYKNPFFLQENKSYDQLKKELGGKEDVFEHVIASLSATTMNGAAPSSAEETSQPAPAAKAPVKDFYSIEELTEGELPEGIDMQRKEV